MLYDKGSCCSAHSFPVAFDTGHKAVFGAIQIIECGLEPPNRLKRCYSLKRNKEFRYAYRTGRSAGCKSMVLIYAKGRADEVKIGFSVSKKLGNAVVRNRIKRRLREAVTPLIPNIKTGCKLIIIAKLPIKTEKLPAIESSMRYMIKKANLLMPSGGICEAKDSGRISPHSTKEQLNSVVDSPSNAENEKQADCSGKPGLKASVPRSGEGECAAYE